MSESQCLQDNHESPDIMLSLRRDKHPAANSEENQTEGLQEEDILKDQVVKGVLPV